MKRQVRSVLGANIDAVGWDEVLNRISSWSRERASRYVCICNVHSVVTASRDPEFLSILNSADTATPDGMPVAWMLRRLGITGQQRINGPDLMWKYCEVAAQRGESIYLFGNTEQTLVILREKLKLAFPGLSVVGMHSPPFRPLTSEEDVAIVDQINASGAGTVFVSLGCPKQEVWMASHRGRINAVMIGVGAAFDYHAGTIRRAPLWMQNCGLEWLHRLASEPARLWKRYLVTNTAFMLGATRQLISRRR